MADAPDGGHLIGQGGKQAGLAHYGAHVQAGTLVDIVLL